MAYEGHHITPFKTLLHVFIALVILTLLTVFTSRIHLGILHIPMAIGIAVAKAALVVSIFMGLKWDNKINAVVLSVGVAFVMIFLAFTLFDTAFRGDLPSTVEGTIMEQQREDEQLREEDPGPPQLPAQAEAESMAQ